MQFQIRQTAEMGNVRIKRKSRTHARAHARAHTHTHAHTHTELLINLFSREYTNWCWILHSFTCTLHPELQSKHILWRNSCLSNSLYILPCNSFMDFCYICYREHTCSYGTNLIFVLVFISLLKKAGYKNVIYIIKWCAMRNYARWTFIAWNLLESLRICLMHFLFIVVWRRYSQTLRQHYCFFTTIHVTEMAVNRNTIE
jgi:hypothetical protein